MLVLCIHAAPSLHQPNVIKRKSTKCRPMIEQAQNPNSLVLQFELSRLNSIFRHAKTRHDCLFCTSPPNTRKIRFSGKIQFSQSSPLGPGVQTRGSRGKTHEQHVKTFGARLLRSTAKYVTDMPTFSCMNCIQNNLNRQVYAATCILTPCICAV